MARIEPEVFPWLTRRLPRNDSLNPNEPRRRSVMEAADSNIISICFCRRSQTKKLGLGDEEESAHMYVQKPPSQVAGKGLGFRDEALWNF
jgi:hypothetical protein